MLKIIVKKFETNFLFLFEGLQWDMQVISYLYFTKFTISVKMESNLVKQDYKDKYKEFKYISVHWFVLCYFVPSCTECVAWIWAINSNHLDIIKPLWGFSNSCFMQGLVRECQVVWGIVTSFCLFLLNVPIHF